MSLAEEFDLTLLTQEAGHDALLRRGKSGVW
jgi:hypothetical protein